MIPSPSNESPTIPDSVLPPLPALNVTVDVESTNLFRCPKCRKQHTQIRTDEQQQKVRSYVESDRKILEYTIKKEQEQHDKLSDRVGDIEEKNNRIENKKRLEKLLSKLPK